MRRTLIAGIGSAIGALALLTACDSSPSHTSSEASTTSTIGASRGNALAFREVTGVVPYTSSTASATNQTGTPTSCNGGELVTPPAQATAVAQVVLPDRGKTHCYLLGPVVLTGHNIDRAVAQFDPMQGSWVVVLHFGNDDFGAKVASQSRYINHDIAMVFDGTVLSAPRINAGITGNEVVISGDFDEATAKRLAAALS